MALNKKKKSKLVIKLISICLMVAAIALLSSLLVKLNEMFILQKQAEEVEEQLAILQEENATLTSTKEKLEDPDYIQTYARGEYMFSKGDEKVFYLPSEE